MICNECGRRISMAYVAMADECPGCGASPVVEKVAPTDIFAWLTERSRDPDIYDLCDVPEWLTYMRVEWEKREPLPFS